MAVRGNSAGCCRRARWGLDWRRGRGERRRDRRRPCWPFEEEGETEDMAIEVGGAADVADWNPNLQDAVQFGGHGLERLFRFFQAATLALRGTRRRVAEGGSDEFGVEIFRYFEKPAVLDAKNVAVGIVVGHAVVCGVLAARFDDDVVVFGDDAVGGCGNGRRKLGAKGAEKFLQNGLLARVFARPWRGAGDGPTEIVVHGFDKRGGIALSELGEDVLQQFLVLSGAHGVV